MSLMSKDIVFLDVDVSSREEAITKMADAMDAAGNLADKDQYIQDVFDREKTATTAVGFSIATPHAKSAGVKEACLGFMRFNNELVWSEDAEPVTMMFQIAVPEGGANQHLDILQLIFRNLIHDDFREKLSKVNSPEEVCEMIEQI